MSDKPDWGAIGKQAQARSEAETANRQAELDRAREQSIARDAFRKKATAALRRIRDICEKNCGEYNTTVNNLRYRVTVHEITGGFVVAKGNGVVHAGFTLEPLRGKSLLVTRESSMTVRNAYTNRLDAIEIDDTVRFGKVALEFEESKDEDIANEACLWVMNTEEST